MTTKELGLLSKVYHLHENYATKYISDSENSTGCTVECLKYALQHKKMALNYRLIAQSLPCATQDNGHLDRINNLKGEIKKLSGYIISFRQTDRQLLAAAFGNKKSEILTVPKKRSISLRPNG